jgi:hypothetical protein
VLKGESLKVCRKNIENYFYILGFKIKMLLLQTASISTGIHQNIITLKFSINRNETTNKAYDAVRTVKQFN